jgi:hypothetical protein
MIMEVPPLAGQHFAKDTTSQTFACFVYIAFFVVYMGKPGLYEVCTANLVSDTALRNNAVTDYEAAW